MCYKWKRKDSIRRVNNTTDISDIHKIQHADLLNVTVDQAVCVLCFQMVPGSFLSLETANCLRFFVVFLRTQKPTSDFVFFVSHEFLYSIGLIAVNKTKLKQIFI